MLTTCSRCFRTVPKRTSCFLATLKAGPALTPSYDLAEEPPAKRVRTDPNDCAEASPQDLMLEVETFATILSNTLDLDS